MNKLKLNKNIYSFANLKMTINAYKEIANIEVNEDDRYYLCTFLECTYDIEETKKEFENYLIDLVNVYANN